MNRFNFLRNYKQFAAYNRYRTAKILLIQLQKSRDSLERRAIMLRIIEDLVSSTEDLAMWLVAVMGRNDSDKKFNDEWERLLSIEINDKTEKHLTIPTEVLSSFKRIKTLKSFLKKMDFPSIHLIATELGSDESLVVDGVEKVRSSIKIAVSQRTDCRGMLPLVQNKIKHGMMVYTDGNTNTSWIRIFNVKFSKDKKRVIRRNRNIEVPVDIKKANDMTNTILAYGQAVEGLINVLLIDYKYRIITGKIRTKKPYKEKYLNEINKALHTYGG